MFFKKLFSRAKNKYQSLPKPNLATYRNRVPKSLSAIRSGTFSWRKLRRKLTWRKIARATIICVGAGLVCGALLFAWYFKDLPKPGELRSRSTDESTILYDRNGKQIYDISGEERRILLKNDEIPDIIKKATVSIEDPNFYDHYGVDFRGLARAVIFAGNRGGGSTITQQYIKNAILSPQRTLTRKVKEIILSLEVEAVYSKEDILALYLNEIPYGSNIYGVEAASQAYYGKSAKEKGLTLAEAATLASIPRAPTRYSPYGNNINLLMSRKNKVLDNMAKAGHITQDEANTAKKEAPLEAKDFAQRRDNFPAPHFVMYVREQLVQKYGEELVQRGGLRVTTSLDLDVQHMADDAIQEVGKSTLPKVNASNASLVALDPKTGQVLAMVGSLDYFDRENEGNFNVATAQRQPGSAIKPLVYASLFKEKWGPTSVLWDVETDFNGYKPQNFDGRFHGPLTIRKALGNSFNIPAVKALSLVGVDDFIKQSKDMGITTFDDKKSAGLSLALGGGEVKLVDLVAAYGVLANNGDKYPLTSIIKIADSKGKVLDEWKANAKRVLAPEVAFEVSDILSDTEAKQPAFGRTLGVLTVKGKRVASKTGTTNNYKDAWTVGYTPSIVIGVWAGNNNGDEMDRGGGSTAAAPIWDAFMETYLANKPDESFYKPESIQLYTVDLLSGKRPTHASGQLSRDYFAPWQIPTKDDDYHKVVRVCKSNGFVANDDAPAEETEDRVYTQVRSERPDNPAWEGPVQAWARGSGIASEPAKEKCDVINRNPTIVISTPANNSVVSGVFTVAADVKLPEGSTGSVDFALDGARISTDSSDPYSTTINASTLSAGSHTLSATVTTSFGTSDTDTITVQSSKDVTPPGNASNVIVVPGTSSGSASVTWTNPNDADLESVTFYVSQASGVKGARLSTVAANPGTVQNATLLGLISGVTNYITLIPTDTSGNTATSTQQYSVTPL